MARRGQRSRRGGAANAANASNASNVSYVYIVIDNCLQEEGDTVEPFFRSLPSFNKIHGAFADRDAAAGYVRALRDFTPGFRELLPVGGNWRTANQWRLGKTLEQSVPRIEIRALRVIGRASLRAKVGKLEAEVFADERLERLDADELAKS